jgi:hypothetical protein
MTAINWTPLYKKYKGMWVALLDDEITVVGYGKTLKEAKLKAKKNGYNHPIFTRMPPSLSAYAGGAL